MARRRLQKVALYSLVSDGAARADDPAETDASPGSEKEYDIVLLTRKVGESVLVPARGLTIQVGSIRRNQVSLRITVPSETSLFRLGVAEGPSLEAHHEVQGRGT